MRVFPIKCSLSLSRFVCVVWTMLSHFSPSGGTPATQEGGSVTGASMATEMDACHLAFQAKYVSGKLQVGAVARVLRRGSVDDPRLAQLRATASGARESADFRNACRTKAWTLHMFEFHDSENFCNLESLLVRFSPKVVYYEASGRAGLARPKLEGLFDHMKIDGRLCKGALFKGTGVQDDLARLLGVTQTDHMPEMRLTMALGAAACLMGELRLGYRQAGDHYTIEHGHLSQYVRLDTAAMTALNLLPTKGDPNKFCSVFGVLDHCKTPMGRRVLERWLRQPLTDLDAITKRQDVVEYLVDDSELRDDLIQEKLKGIGDIDAVVRKLKDSKAALKDLWALRQMALSLPKIRSRLEESMAYSESETKAGFGETFQAPMKNLEEEFSTFVQFVETAIDVEEYERGGQLRISPMVSKDLMGLRNQMEAMEGKINDYIHCDLGRVLPSGISANDVKHDLPGKHDDGHSLRIHKKFEKHAKKIKGYKELKVVKAGVCFTTMRLRSFSESWEGLRDTYKRESKKYLSQAVDCAATYLPIIELASEILSKLDVFVSMAHTASTALGGMYTRPKMTKLGARGNIKLERARHPCLECQDDVNFIPNDYELNRDDSRLLVVTGPNMGGKSTYIRQLGIVLVLAQIGSFVPADDAELCIVDAVLARVGAGDAQLKGVSTFMAEMLEAAAILATGTENSMVIIDELGRGTSTNDGYGLAWAIAEAISKKESFCMFATHFHEMTALAESAAGVKNLHATAITTNNSITMKYEIQPGPCDRSFGIHVAELAAFPRDVIQNAKRKADALEGDQWYPVVKSFGGAEDLEKANVTGRVEKIMKGPSGKRVFAYPNLRAEMGSA